MRIWRLEEISTRHIWVIICCSSWTFPVQKMPQIRSAFNRTHSSLWHEQISAQIGSQSHWGAWLESSELWMVETSDEINLMFSTRDALSLWFLVSSQIKYLVQKRWFCPKLSGWIVSVYISGFRVPSIPVPSATKCKSPQKFISGPQQTKTLTSRTPQPPWPTWSLKVSMVTMKRKTHT